VIPGIARLIPVKIKVKMDSPLVSRNDEGRALEGWGMKAKADWIMPARENELMGWFGRSG